MKKILLVDDDIDLLEQSKISFESKGYKVAIAKMLKKDGKHFKKKSPMLL